MVAFRVRGIGSSARPRLAPEAPAAAPPPAPVDERAVLFDPAAGAVPTPVYRRDALAPGLRLAGPCIVEEPSSTTIVLPDAHLAVDGFRNLILTLGTEHA